MNFCSLVHDTLTFITNLCEKYFSCMVLNWQSSLILIWKNAWKCFWSNPVWQWKKKTSKNWKQKPEILSKLEKLRESTPDWSTKQARTLIGYEFVLTSTFVLNFPISKNSGGLKYWKNTHTKSSSNERK